MATSRCNLLKVTSRVWKSPRTHAYFDTLVASDSLDKDEDDKEVRLRVLLPNVQFPPHVSCRMLLYLRQQ